MSLLEQLYKELILEHYKHPRNKGTLEPALVHEGVNPSCGDEVKLFLQLEDNTIKDIKFLGEGCAISQASASMMTEAIKGKSLEDAAELSQRFKAMIQGEPPVEELGDLKMLQGISKLHARVKCAMLAWMTLEQVFTTAKAKG
ncbi:MAG: Fe-S cluster assembly sulfur transfer protein SufU [Trueperaceae bacterium]